MCIITNYFVSVIHICREQGVIRGFRHYSPNPVYTLILDTPPPPPAGGGPFRGCWKNQDSRAILSLSRARKTPPESCLSLVYRGFLGVFRGGGGGGVCLRWCFCLNKR